MAIVFADLVRQAVSGAPGTASTISLAGAQTGWLTFALAGVANGATVRYAINDNGASEIGTATYNSSGPSLTGRTPTKSTNSNAAINASAQAIVIGCLAAEDTIITLGSTTASLNGSAVGTTANPLSALVWTNSTGPQFLNGSGSLSGGVNGAEIFKYSDNNFYLDNYDAGSFVFRGNSFAQLMTITGAGKVGIGTFQTPDSLLTVNANTAAGSSPPSGTVAHIVGAAGSSTNILSDTYGGRTAWASRRADGTIGSPSAVQSGDNIFAFTGFGYGATGYSSAARVLINALAAQNWSDTAQGTQLVFQTTALNTTTTATAMSIFASGAVGIGTGTDPGVGGLNVLSTQGASVVPVVMGSTASWLSMITAYGGPYALFVSPLGNTALRAASRTSDYVGGTSPVQDIIGMDLYAYHDATTNTGTPPYNGAWATYWLVERAFGAYAAINLFGCECSMVNLGAGVQADPFNASSAGMNTIFRLDSGSGTSTIGGHPVNPLTTGVEVSNDGGAFYNAFRVNCNALVALGSTPNYQAIQLASIPTGSAGDGHSIAWYSAANTVSGWIDVDTLSEMRFHSVGVYKMGDAATPVASLGLTGSASGATGGAFFAIANTSTVVFSLGNYSAAWGHSHTGAPSYDALGTCVATTDLVIQPTNWLYVSGMHESGPGGFNSGGTTPIQPSGLAFGWNQSGGGGEANIVNNIDTGAGTTGPWDFIFQDWNGTTLSNLAYINKGGGIYIPNTLMQTTVGGGYGTGTTGTLPTPGVAGTADTFFADGFFSSDSTARTVPYNSSGVWIGDALQSTLFIGNTSAGTTDPTPQGSTQTCTFSTVKTNAAAGSSVYGQTGSQLIHVVGGWAGSACTFTQSVTLVNGVKTYNLSAAPTNHAYVPGMPVVSSGSPGVLPASTVIVSVSGNTITLNNAPTTPGACTLTFWAGRPVTAPITTTPTVPTVGYNPYAGTPGDTFAVNGMVSFYDNGLGIGEWLECSVAQFTPGSSTANYQCKLTQAIVTAGNLTLFGSGGSLTSAHQIGCSIQFLVGGGGYGVFVASPGGAGFNFAGTGTGHIMDSSFSVSTPSEPTIKRDIEKLPSMIDAVMAIDPVTFWYTDEWREQDHRIGFLARDFGGFGGAKERLPAAVRDIIVTDETGVTGLRQGGMLPGLWRATQEVIDRLNGIEARVEALEGRPH
jgi:hypothetical protein